MSSPVFGQYNFGAHYPPGSVTNPVDIFDESKVIGKVNEKLIEEGIEKLFGKRGPAVFGHILDADQLNTIEADQERELLERIIRERMIPPQMRMHESDP